MLDVPDWFLSAGGASGRNYWGDRSVRPIGPSSALKGRGISSSAPDALLQRMLDKIDALCGKRDWLKNCLLP